jgi:hypothetical protein
MFARVAARTGPKPVETARELRPSGGRTLDANARAYFEPRFGFDFSQVRVFSDEQAADAAQSIGALAYTTGSNIVFGKSRYQPGTGEGLRLLAHELTHVIQQGTGRTTPAIQRDTPRGQQTSPADASDTGIRVSITKRLELVPKAAVQEALTRFLEQVQYKEGTQTLPITEAVKFAVRKMFAEDPTASATVEGLLKTSNRPSSPEDFAQAVTNLLPEFVELSRVAHLGTLSARGSSTNPKSASDVAGDVVVNSTVGPLVKKLPKSWQDTILDAARGAVTQGGLGILDAAMSGSPLTADQQNAIHSAIEAVIKQQTGSPAKGQEEAGSPYAPVQPPPSAPPIGSVSAPGEHIVSIPAKTWDFPSGARIPKPNIPQPPPASQAASVDQVIQALDEESLIPSAAKGKPEATNFDNARILAAALANLLADADKKKQHTVQLTISGSYRHVDDLREIFDRMETIVRMVANALPENAANVDQVIITPKRLKGDKIPPQWTVHLHGN